MLTVLVATTGLCFAQDKQADNDYTTGAVLWQQSSGEARALFIQGYKLARLMLDRDFRVNRRNRRPRAVVVDADETIIDNSKFQAELIKTGLQYSSAGWSDWCKREKAAALPGALEFLRYANSRGVRVFYVTNRRANEWQCTADNLKKLGFPRVTKETLLVRTDEKSSSKEPRRQSIASHFRIVLLAGDNLNDFSDVFERKSNEERSAIVDRLKNEFGTRFIVLPNPMYGDWESAVYNGNSRLSDDEKAKLRKEALKGYEAAGGQ
jgi:5'-nucleotidase (lipoprotein e(P4) family)